MVPPSVDLAPPARSAIDAEWLTPDERKDLRVFHGVWDEGDLDTIERRAMAALRTWALLDPVLVDLAAPVELRAEAALRRGEIDDALALLEGASSMHATRLRAEALETLGRFDEADRSIDEPVGLLLTRRLEDAGSLTEGVRSLIIRSRIRGQPARDYATMMDLLARSRQSIDRLHWPTMLTEADLLLDKDNTTEGLAAIQQTLSLNPRCSEAWYLLGRIALDRFDFDSARQAAENLRRLNRRHPLADLLMIRAAIIQGDSDVATSLLADILARYPLMREALALRCAAVALTYDEAALRDALTTFDAASPGSAAAHYEAGRALALDRQYELAADLLSEAARRRPAWPEPRVELGLLEMQSGRDALALEALRAVRELDPFNKRVANSLFLLEELLAKFTQVETEHFVIRFSPETEDRVMADLMVERLEAIHATVASRFEHKPDRKTVIELMPDHMWFGVRITGMPHIHTIAACTGPVIAMEAPREGPPREHFGIYDWPRVIQHEYTHTITLSQTRNRLPHWLTEAAAVTMEPGARGYDTELALAAAWHEHRLFDLDEINWAFIRPKRPGDRSLAYAQGAWMVEFMNERFGESALIRLLERYFEGDPEARAIPAALDMSREAFYEAFLAWAGEQVRAWGLAPQPSLESLKDELRAADPALVELMRGNERLALEVMAASLTDRIGTAAPVREASLGAADWLVPPKPEVQVSEEALAEWLERHPDHPDLLQMAVERAVAMNDGVRFNVVPLIESYAAARPIDPMPHRLLAKFWQDQSEHGRAAPHLEFLDAREQYDEVYALALAQHYRVAKDAARAIDKVDRAVNINPYFAPHRELAAAIAIEAGDLPRAQRHIVALTILEPDRPQHARRLEAIERMIAEREGQP